MNELKALVDELVFLNDDNLAQRVIDNNDVQWCLSELQDMLLADVVPVAHGRWLDIKRYNDGERVIATCSRCKERGELRTVRTEFGVWEINSPYCPNCGAKMDGGIDNAID